MPAEAKRALEHISRTSRASLAEIRRLLGLVRSGEPTATYSPTPGLADLAQLAREWARPACRWSSTSTTAAASCPGRGAGRLPHRAGSAHQRGPPRPRPEADGADRHWRWPGARGRVRRLLRVQGRGRPVRGHGLVGMRERVAVYGGSLDVGPSPEGGFPVDATIPYEDEPVR